MKNHYEIGSVVFGKWSIARRIGAGSFGTVYEIRREEFDQIYTAALKVITVPQGEMEFQDALDEGMTRSQAEDYFYTMVKDIVREFAIMARLKGTGNVVCYEDHEVVPHDDGTGWDILIRMELLNPLMPYAYGHPLSRRDVIRLGIDMCKALELCQRYNIIHRDIKPENIFVSDNGDFKLGDFGIARTIERTMSGLSKKGTYNYMAPEVYRGSEYGFSVDIYSLGIVLYRLLNNNRAPFLPQPPEPITYSQRETALARRMGGEQPPAPVNAGGRLGEIVLKACAFDPKARYSSPIQMRQELESIQYSPEDGQIIYPSGDELSLYENQYATQKSRAESIAPPEPSDAPAPVAAEVTEKTESVFGGGAPEKSAQEKAPEKVPEEFFAPAGGETKNFWPEEGMEKTESVFGRGPVEPDPADAAPNAGNGQVEKPTKSKRRKILIAAVVALLCIPVVFFLMYQDVFDVLSNMRMPPVPDTVQRDLDDFDGNLGYSFGPFGKLTGWDVCVRSDDNTEILTWYEYTADGIRTRAYVYNEDGKLMGEEIYNELGQVEQYKSYHSDGTLNGIMTYEYSSDGRERRGEYYDADGNLLVYVMEEYYDNGNVASCEEYDSEDRLTGVQFYDENGGLTRVETYDENGNSIDTGTYLNGKLIGTEIYDGSSDMIEVTNICWSGYDYIDVWLEDGRTMIGVPAIIMNIQTEFDDSTGLNPYENFENWDVSILNADFEEVPNQENLLGERGSSPDGLITCRLNTMSFEPGYYIIHVEVSDSSGNWLGDIDVSICVGEIGTIVNAGPVGIGWEDLVLQNMGTGGCLSFDGTSLFMNYGDVDESGIWHLNYEWKNSEYNSIYCSAFGADKILDIDNAAVFDGNLVKIWTCTDYDVQYWDSVCVHVMGQGYGENEMIVSMAKDDSGEEYCLAWDPQENTAVIRPVSQADEYCVWTIQ